MHTLRDTHHTLTVSENKMKTINKAQKLLELIRTNPSEVAPFIQACKKEESWFNVSSKTYDLRHKQEEKQRKIDLDTPNISCASLDEIQFHIETNELLSEIAVSTPVFSNMTQIENLNRLIKTPNATNNILEVIEKETMHPTYRIYMQKGRHKHLPSFQVFDSIVEAASIAYYQGNFISSFFTLVPIVEGIMLRWAGFDGENKPSFDELRKFFKNSYLRNPCPGNILFHKSYARSCDLILNNHFFKPSKSGNAHNNFNRHLAAHLLSDSEFATQNNCVRLFLLIDLMSEIYLLENNLPDPRFTYNVENHSDDKKVQEKYITLMLKNKYFR